MRDKRLYGHQIWIQMKDGTTSKLFYNLESSKTKDSLDDWKKMTANADKEISCAIYQEVWLDQDNVESYYDLDYYGL